MTAGFPIRRVLVALDLSMAARTALPEALRLATRLRTEVMGLFVEDARLVTACAGEGVPTGHVSIITGQAEALDARAMEAGLRAQSVMLSRHVSATAAALRCHCELHTLRGAVAETLVAQATGDDLLVLSRRPGHVGATLAATIRSVAAPVLVLPPGETVEQGRITVIADTVEGLSRGLAAAARFTADVGRRVDILLGPGVPKAVAEEQVTTAGLPVRVAAVDHQADLSACIRSDTGLVIVSPDSEGLSGARLTAFLAQARMPVLLVR